MTDAQSTDSDEDDGEELMRVGTSPLEWAIAALGGALTCFLIGYLIYIGLAQPAGMPTLVTKASAAQPTVGGSLIEVRVRNDGDGTAAGVIVSGELRDGDKVVEDAEATIDYVPQQSERTVLLQFTEDPARYQLKVRVRGFSEP